MYLHGRPDSKLHEVKVQIKFVLISSISHRTRYRTQKSIKLWEGAGAIVANLMNDLGNRYSNDPVVQVW